ncbi:hypothetical protein SDC9_82638 [bioreactor metagenome]|uniref:Uncharacterized protein n=1 Tax=bioreactor metagenome TaxID=1076179 RepID=A0A644ZBE1_9ZZZZ
MSKLLLFFGEGFHDCLQGFTNFKVGKIQTNVHGTRVSIICTLSHVYMVVGTDEFILPPLFSYDFQSSVCNNFIGVHVHAGSGTTLDHINGKVLQMFSLHKFLASGHYCIFYLIVDQAEFVVGKHSSHLDYTKGLCEFGVFREVIPGYIKVLDTPECLNTVQCFYGNLFCP